MRKALIPNILGAVVAVLTAVILTSIVRVSPDDSPSVAPEFTIPLAWVALSVLLIIFVIAFLTRGISIRLGGFFPWIIGIASFVASFIPWYFVLGANTELGARIYQGLKVPQGIYQFWDLSLTLQGIDCARKGFDVYAANNGCLQDPSIYGPGTFWFQYIPFISNNNSSIIGVGSMLISSVMLMWLARNSQGGGQVVLLIAAFGGPWLLLLERGNLDAVVMWVAVFVIALTRRYPNLGAWAIAAALIWILGTWKYYPFALGVLLLPALAVKRGWIVLSGFVLATAIFMILTWDNFRFSSAANENMVDYGDFVVLGRIPVVARMIDDYRAGNGGLGTGELGTGDLLFYALALVALAWGATIAFRLNQRQIPRIQSLAYLALGGSGLYIASVLIAGFGYGYKAAFLLLSIPLISRFTAHKDRAVVIFSIAVLLLIALQSVVVWNSAMVTVAGVIASAGVAGIAAGVAFRGSLLGDSNKGKNPAGIASP